MNTSFPSTYSRMLARELQLDDAGIERLLAGTALAKKDLFTLDRQIGLADQYTIIQNGLALTGNPALGLQIGSHMPLTAHGPLGVAIGSAPTTRDAFELLARFGVLRVPTLTVETAVDADRLLLILHSDGPVDLVGRFLIEVMLASLMVLAEIPQGVVRQRPVIELAYAEPAHGGYYRDYLLAELRFNRPRTTVSFALRELQLPNPFAEPEIYAQAIAMCERLQLRQASQESWCSKVTGLLQQHPGHIWHIRDIADALHVSVRSLTRHLAQEQSSYQQLLDAELCRQAELHLAMPGHTVASVANLLGYQDVSSFRRAFRRWRGVPPQDWREEDRADRANMA